MFRFTGVHCGAGIGMVEHYDGKAGMTNVLDTMTEIALPVKLRPRLKLPFMLRPAHANGATDE